MKPLRWSSELGIPHLELLYFSLGRKHKKARLRDSSHPGIGLSSRCGKNCLKVNTVTLSETGRQAPAALSFPRNTSHWAKQAPPATNARVKEPARLSSSGFVSVETFRRNPRKTSTALETLTCIVREPNQPGSVTILNWACSEVLLPSAFGYVFSDLVLSRCTTESVYCFSWLSHHLKLRVLGNNGLSSVTVARVPEDMSCFLFRRERYR